MDEDDTVKILQSLHELTGEEHVKYLNIFEESINNFASFVCLIKILKESENTHKSIIYSYFRFIKIYIEKFWGKMNQDEKIQILELVFPLNFLNNVIFSSLCSLYLNLIDINNINVLYVSVSRCVHFLNSSKTEDPIPCLYFLEELLRRYRKFNFEQYDFDFLSSVFQVTHLYIEKGRLMNQDQSLVLLYCLKIQFNTLFDCVFKKKLMNYTEEILNLYTDNLKFLIYIIRFLLERDSFSREQNELMEYASSWFVKFAFFFRPDDTGIFSEILREITPIFFDCLEKYCGNDDFDRRILSNMVITLYRVVSLYPFPPNMSFVLARLVKLNQRNFEDFISQPSVFFHENYFPSASKYAGLRNNVLAYVKILCKNYSEEQLCIFLSSLPLGEPCVIILSRISKRCIHFESSRKLLFDYSTKFSSDKSNFYKKLALVYLYSSFIKALEPELIIKITAYVLSMIEIDNYIFISALGKYLCNADQALEKYNMTILDENIFNLVSEYLTVVPTYHLAELILRYGDDNENVFSNFTQHVQNILNSIISNIGENFDCDNDDATLLYVKKLLILLERILCYIDEYPFKAMFTFVTTVFQPALEFKDTIIDIIKYQISLSSPFTEELILHILLKLNEAKEFVVFIDKIIDLFYLSLQIKPCLHTQIIGEMKKMFESGVFTLDETCLAYSISLVAYLIRFCNEFEDKFILSLVTKYVDTSDSLVKSSTMILLSSLILVRDYEVGKYLISALMQFIIDKKVAIIEEIQLHTSALCKYSKYSFTIIQQHLLNELINNSTAFMGNFDDDDVEVRIKFMFIY